MELFPILDRRDQPADNLWYVISPKSAAQVSGGVGSKIVSRDSDVYVTCGAQPDQSFGTVFHLSLDTLKLRRLGAEFAPRYEHGAAVHGDEILVFGGADTDGNRGDLQSIKLDGSSTTATDVTARGSAPSPRTVHNVGRCDGAVFVWGGGALGGQPVTETDIHRLDLSSREWTTFSGTGDVPSPRHGHVTVCAGNTLYIHGGMSGETVFDDLYSVDLTTLTENGVCHWTKCQSVTKPGARAAHSSTSHSDSSFFIFGGFTGQDALNDLWVFNTGKGEWSMIEVPEPRPPPRLDLTICTALLPVSDTPDKDSRPVDMVARGPIQDITSLLHEAVEQPSQESDDEPLPPPTSFENCLIVFGGMDLLGNIFNDIYLIKI